ncbi:MAG: 5-bromo-4-chloroindolyl phosphate hydrolysis family protein [Tannerellaceae bacterium]|nr:5-bromo-4-chloroindolyl phosphate hydrolysis family protein [Tannerellaceae bacterium]
MGRTLVTNLRKWKKEIESVPLQNDIEELVQICLIVMKRNDVEAWKFFTTYADKLELMLSKYDEIENTRINSPEMLHTMGLIEKSISEIVVAFRNEVNEMYKKDMIDLNAETKAFMYNLRNKGLIG